MKRMIFAAAMIALAAPATGMAMPIPHESVPRAETAPTDARDADKTSEDEKAPPDLPDPGSGTVDCNGNPSLLPCGHISRRFSKTQPAPPSGRADPNAATAPGPSNPVPWIALPIAAAAAIGGWMLWRRRRSASDAGGD
ncbi:MAG TPA: hypothetical protein VHY34_02870 [Caulobacteraceae bacterium]|nr:hypothetical protein [Caulobacteraceae bacterium]